jgi:hypothetical protein
VYRQLQRLIQEWTRVQTAKKIDTRESKSTDTYIGIDTGEDNSADSYRNLILERISVNSYRD